ASAASYVYKRQNPDKMAIVDFSAVLNHIGYLESGANESVFTIEVVDRFNKVCEQTVSLTVNVEKLELTLSNPETLMMEDDELALTMDYNGFDAEKNVKFQYYNQRGTWTGLSVKSITPVARSSKSYRVVLTVPADDKDLSVRAVSGNTESATLDVKRTEPPFKLACNENDVFATRALLSVSGDNESPAELAAKAKLLLSTDGGASYSEYTSLTQDGGNLNLSGLEHNTVYTARIVIDGMQSRAITFTTEEKLAIPYGNLDAPVSNDGSGSKWENVVFDGWGTNNPMTTSQGGNFAYCRISGTKQTDDAHNGKAARIRTHGWGSGNSALGSMNGACKYIDAGLLHLGSSRTSRPDGFGSISGPLSTDDLDCGIEFASRPSAVSFWYKYSPKNSEDKGSAKAVVYDASGNIIAEGSLALDKADQYGEISIPLNYSAGSAKAAKIYICFMSTNNENALKKDKNWLTPPPFGGDLGRGEYSGSTLFIDEVTLNY
ncbi:MAG: PCMD domain-containing protein, partial [Muribaculaceae bacterium]|nr:PCMD domain-containing protein [Muribaculaceae bacterium]